MTVQADSERHGRGGYGEADGGFSSAAEREAQAEADHVATRPRDSELTLPSRTMTSRSA